MEVRYPAHRGCTSRFSVGALLFFAGLLPAFVAISDTHPPVKLAIFDFELEDFSAGGQLIGESPDDTAQLKLATSEARRLIAQSGRYSLVDAGSADEEAVKAHWLRKCNGCDAGIAFKLGADQSLVGVVTRVSRMEYTVGFQIRDARSGAVIFNKHTDLRMGANYSWSRGVVWLIENRLLNSQVQP